MHSAKIWNVRVVVSAVAGLALTGAAAAAVDAPMVDAFPTFENSITFSGTGASIGGNDAAYQARRRSPSNGGAGLDSLRYYRDLSKETALTLEGRALMGTEDYLARVNLNKTDVGTIEAGYKRFRTFYDGIGGFFPINGFWRPLAEEDLHTDRGHLWVTATLALPKTPRVSIRYDNETRTGRKPSLSWGDSNLTGLSLTPANNATRKVIPGELTMGERHQNLEARVEHPFGKTEMTLRLIGNWIKNDDTRVVVRFPGEVTPSPQRITKQRDAFDTSEFGAIATTETTFSDRLSLNTGWSYQHANTDSSGERANALGDLPTYDFKNLVGQATVRTYTGNVSVGLKPQPTLLVRLTLRGEDSYTKASAIYTRVTGTVAAPVSTPMAESSRVKDEILTPDLSVRYTGIPKLVLYASGSDRIDRGDRRHVNPYSTLAALPVSSIYGQDVEQDQAQYRFGANWNQSAAFTARGEVFRKNHQNKFLGYANRLGDRYVVGYNFTGVKLTGIVKPIPELAFTTRYVPQTGYIDVTTDATARWDSMTAKSHLISETIDWNPIPQFYVQAGLDLGFNYISTAYPRAQTPATIAPQANADNNYVVESFVSGFAADKLTDIQLQLSHQHAHNYLPQLATGTTPYGSGYSESSATLALKRKLSATWLATAKLGYIDSQSEATGGRTDFHGPLAYLAFEHEL